MGEKRPRVVVMSRAQANCCRLLPTSLPSPKKLSAHPPPSTSVATHDAIQRLAMPASRRRVWDETMMHSLGSRWIYSPVPPIYTRSTSQIKHEL